MSLHRDRSGVIYGSTLKHPHVQRLGDELFVVLKGGSVAEKVTEDDLRHLIDCAQRALEDMERWTR